LGNCYLMNFDTSTVLVGEIRRNRYGRSGNRKEQGHKRRD